MKKNILKNILILSLVLLSSINVFAQGNGEKQQSDSTQLRVGVSPGPYGSMVEKALKPYLEKLGYSVEVITFSDWVQPDVALANGEIEANLMQHTVYLEAFSKANNLDLDKIIAVPTAGAGVFSNKYTSLDQLEDGDQIAFASDATNLARSLRILSQHGIITLKENIDPTKASLLDIASNPKNLEFVTLDGAQISRSLDSVDVAIVPGNYAIAAKLDYTKALAIEKLDEGYKNVITVRSEDVNSQLGKDLKAAVESQDFYLAITSKDDIFTSFDKPQWWIDKYGSEN